MPNMCLNAPAVSSPAARSFHLLTRALAFTYHCPVVVGKRRRDEDDEGFGGPQRKLRSLNRFAGADEVHEFACSLDLKATIRENKRKSQQLLADNTKLLANNTSLEAEKKGLEEQVSRLREELRQTKERHSSADKNRRRRVAVLQRKTTNLKRDNAALRRRLLQSAAAASATTQPAAATTEGIEPAPSMDLDAPVAPPMAPSQEVCAEEEPPASAPDNMETEELRPSWAVQRTEEQVELEMIDQPAATTAATIIEQPQQPAQRALPQSMEVEAPGLVALSFSGVERVEPTAVVAQEEDMVGVEEAKAVPPARLYSSELANMVLNPASRRIIDEDYDVEDESDDDDNDNDQAHADTANRPEPGSWINFVDNRIEQAPERPAQSPSVLAGVNAEEAGNEPQPPAAGATRQTAQEAPCDLDTMLAQERSNQATKEVESALGSLNFAEEEEDEVEEEEESESEAGDDTTPPDNSFQEYREASAAARDNSPESDGEAPIRRQPVSRNAPSPSPRPTPPARQSPAPPQSALPGSEATVDTDDQSFEPGTVSSADLVSGLADQLRRSDMVTGRKIWITVNKVTGKIEHWENGVKVPRSSVAGLPAGCYQVDPAVDDGLREDQGEDLDG